MVTLVGWDDSYEKENFSASSNVTSDGAWIAKNSWGTKWGDNGYFYISYQDPSLLALITTEASIETVYPNNYFYDGSSLDLISVLPAGGSVANIYSVKADQTKAEILGEVTSYIASGDTTFTIEVYTDLKDLTDPCSGVLAAKLENVYQKYGGIFTRKIPETLLLPGTSYSVVLTAKPESKTLSIIVEASQNVSGQIVSEADIRPGQSFYREAGQEWTDLADGSPVRNKETGEIERKTPGCMRLKAHTRTISPELYLSETELSMYAGESSDVTVTLTPEIFEGKSFTVTSNHPEIAAAEITDSHILRVTANAPGTAVLTCKSVSVPGLSKTITVKVSLAAVQCKAKAKSGCVNTISWNKISGAGGYYVYRKVYGKTWKRIAVIEKPSVVTYKDKDAEALTKYEYCVRAYRMVNQNIYKGDFIASDPVVTSPACQKIKTLTSVSGGIKLTWTPQKKASGYQIYRKTRSGKWILLKDLTKGTKNTFTDKTAKKNILYYYSVRAYVKQPDGSKLAGSYKAKSGLRM